MASPASTIPDVKSPFKKNKFGEAFTNMIYLNVDMVFSNRYNTP